MDQTHYTARILILKSPHYLKNSEGLKAIVYHKHPLVQIFAKF